jgi:hypothetical protein
MKKIICLLCLSLLFMPYGASAEPEENPLVGVGAKVYKKDGAYIVITEGKQKNEGFVHKEINLDSKQMHTFRVFLKGTGTVQLKIEEHNAKGEIVKADTSPPFQLMDKWEMHELTVCPDKLTKQIDELVITTGVQKTEFFLGLKQ